MYDRSMMAPANQQRNRIAQTMMNIGSPQPRVGMPGMSGRGAPPVAPPATLVGGSAGPMPLQPSTAPPANPASLFAAPPVPGQAPPAQFAVPPVPGQAPPPFAKPPTY